MNNNLSDKGFVNLLRLYGHPIKLFSENNFKIKFRFMLIIKFKCKMLSGKRKFSDYIVSKNLSKSILSYIFFPIYKNELRKKRYEISIEQMRIFPFELIKSLSSLLIINSEKKLLYQEIDNSFSKKKRININETNFVTSCCFLKNNKEISLGFSCGFIKVFDIIRKKYFFELKSSNRKILLLYSHPYLNSFIISSDMHLSRLWNLSADLRRVQILSLFQNNKIISCSFRSHGRIIDFSNSQNIVKSFDFERQKWVSRHKFPTNIYCIKNNKNGRLLSIGKKEEIGIFDFRISKQVLTIFSEKNSILCTEWTHEEYGIASSGTTGTISIWDLRNNKKKNEIKFSEKVGVFLKISTDLIVTSGFSNKAIVWNYEINKKIREFSEHNQKLTSLDLTWEGKKCCTTSLDKKIIIQEI
nr:prp4-like protein [Cryptomonas curvata]